jgi:hypothetical protein
MNIWLWKGSIKLSNEWANYELWDLRFSLLRVPRLWAFGMRCRIIWYIGIYVSEEKIKRIPRAMLANNVLLCFFHTKCKKSFITYIYYIHVSIGFIIKLCLYNIMLVIIGQNSDFTCGSNWFKVEHSTEYYLMRLNWTINWDQQDLFVIYLLWNLIQNVHTSSIYNCNWSKYLRYQDYVYKNWIDLHHYYIIAGNSATFRFKSRVRIVV